MTVKAKNLLQYFRKQEKGGKAVSRILHCPYRTLHLRQCLHKLLLSHQPIPLSSSFYIQYLDHSHQLSTMCYAVVCSFWTHMDFFQLNFDIDRCQGSHHFLPFTIPRLVLVQIGCSLSVLNDCQSESVVHKLVHQRPRTEAIFTFRLCIVH